ncbi:hypothetical protein, variant [Blastomyces gilchristii SLH14081]|uniref:Uncharacterized protein n=1 Tax=Blastomyces gilchristii (strain SLH14081) TaxID=559298 RepID=A0A179V2Q3_BLAGS|nr:uncharacterized protein BDBG_08181 [Blastomyces gilchristii SLH14081]XP_031580606.1 hypothetical protein, variant [Blastomyces gilchristii SLH14081]OAT12891.1 hypothetical protein BDBG_08181 [Blastomyces gilchristii SLH14081]OAT12892.1 hypothetical protein, variant [Blastomyces gilchristii SLH14081]
MVYQGRVTTYNFRKRDSYYTYSSRLVGLKFEVANGPEPPILESDLSRAIYDDDIYAPEPDSQGGFLPGLFVSGQPPNLVLEVHGTSVSKSRRPVVAVNEWDHGNGLSEVLSSLVRYPSMA